MSPRHLSVSKSLLALALALTGAACAGGDALAPNHGRVQFVLGGDGTLAAGAPMAVESLGGGETLIGGLDPQHDGEGEERPPFIKAANVTFASILARNLDGVLENVEMELPATVDVVTLETGRQIPLPDGELPAGTYDQVVVVMTEVHLVLWNDTEITINPPGGGWTAISPICPPLVVAVGGSSTVSLTLEVRKSFFFLGDRFHFMPRFRPPFGCGEMPPPPPPPPTT
jgi:hypothetical protein